MKLRDTDIVQHVGVLTIDAAVFERDFLDMGRPPEVIQQPRAYLPSHASKLRRLKFASRYDQGLAGRPTSRAGSYQRGCH